MTKCNSPRTRTSLWRRVDTPSCRSRRAHLEGNSWNQWRSCRRALCRERTDSDDRRSRRRRAAAASFGTARRSRCPSITSAAAPKCRFGCSGRRPPPDKEPSTEFGLKVGTRTDGCKGPSRLFRRQPRWSRTQPATWFARSAAAGSRPSAPTERMTAGWVEALREWLLFHFALFRESNLVGNSMHNLHKWKATIT